MRLNFLIVFFFYSTTFAISQDLANLKNEVEQILEFDYYLNFEEEEGLWIGVIDEDSTFIFSVGNITSDSLTSFQVGSISKLITAEMTKASLKKNNIKPQQKITTLLDLHPTYEDINIAQLLSHQSSLPKDPYFFGKYNKNPNNPYESYPDELIIPELNQYTDYYKASDKDEFKYGNLNYALLGLLLESIESKDYCELVEDTFAENFPSLMCSDEADSLNVGYDKTGQIGEPWNFSGFASSEGLSMNVIDLTQYIRKEFDKSSDFEPIKISKSLSFIAPWYVVNQKRDKQIFSFSGTTSIHSVFVCLNKENKTAVVMMRNSGKGILHLPLSILSMVDNSKKKNK